MMNVQLNPQAGHTDLRVNPLTESRSPRTYIIGGVALALVLGGFWYATHMTASGPRRRDTAAPVKVGMAVRRDMDVIEHTIGTVVPNSTVQITARVQGQLMAAHFKEGDLVKTGDLLFEIDPRPYQAAVAQAEGQMARDQAQYEGYSADARRMVALYAQNAISTAQRDQTVGLSKQLAAALEADKANVAMAKLNLEYTRIRSPVNGKTGPILLQPGNMVVSGSTAPLVVINEIQPVKISFSLPQADLPRIQAMAQKRGLVATVNLHDLGGKDLQAPVDFISNAVNNTNGTIELRANFANTDSALVPGQLVDVVVALSQIPNAIVVPRDAVNTGPDGQYVYVVNDGVAQQRSVKLLFDDGVNDAVVGDVRDGEKVIVDGQLRVIPGAKVTVTASAAKSAAGANGRKGGKGRRGRGDPNPG